MFLVKKFCDMVGTNYSTLRHYERIGLLQPYQEEENRYRRYKPEDAFLVNAFKYYRSLGYDTKKSIQLAQAPEKEYVKEQLLQREAELLEELNLIHHQINTVQRQLKDIAMVENKEIWKIGYRSNLWFLPVSDGYDFDHAKHHEMGVWVQYLPVARYSKWIKINGYDGSAENNFESFGMSIEEQYIHLLPAESLKKARFIPGGECLYYYLATLKRPISQAMILEEISEYLDKHELEICGDIYIEGVRVRDDAGLRGQMVSIPIGNKTEKP